MRKLFLVTFGGSPERAEICLYLNAAAGLYKDCEINCYPIDKDTRSPNYVNTREFYQNYKNFQEITNGSGLELVNISRSESMFENMLEQAGLDFKEEGIGYLATKLGSNLGQSQRLLNICFTHEEQRTNMQGGYYGKANIGSVTGNVLMKKEIYKKEQLYKDIQGCLKGGNELDVVIICSSFGGTGASLGINFGRFLRREFQNEQKFRLHCIHIQPYFCFPDPDQNDIHQIDYKQFYEKSATVTSILAHKNNKNNLICKDGQDAVFDRFYYIGQAALDNVSDKNSAVDDQKNKIHLVDMLVSLAVQDVLLDRDQKGLQLYGYQYAEDGTEKISWKHMPAGIEFETKHMNMMRFCEFMLDCVETIFDKGFEGYSTQRLIMQLYGTKGIMNKTADINRDIDVKLRKEIENCIKFCRKYVEYWVELEQSTHHGSAGRRVTSFFNIDELKRIAAKKNISDLSTTMSKEDNYKLCKIEGESEKQIRKNICLEIYDILYKDSKLKHIARQGSNTAGILMNRIYQASRIDKPGRDHN